MVGSPVRAVLALLLLTNAAFVPGQHAPAARPERVLVPASDLGWHVLRDRTTGVVARMWGGAFAAFGAMADARVADQAARDFLAQHRELLAPGESDFVVVANRLDGALRTVAFEQRVQGMRVVGGQVHVVFANDRVVLAGSEAVPNVRVARRHAGGVIVRTPAGDRVATESPSRTETRYVALDGEVLLRVPRIANAVGTLRFDVPVRHPASTRTLVPAPGARVVVDGQPTTTDVDGRFAWPGAAAAIAEPTPFGASVQIIDEATGALATAQLTAQPDQNVDFARTDEFGDAQLTSFIYASLAKTRAKQMHPTLAWLDTTFVVHVNFNDSCNAQSTGDAIFMFRKNASCENTGRLADVVLHEFAHSFHTQSIIPGAGAFESSLAEGIADFFAANITGDPGVGRGFSFTEDPVRDLAPRRVFPTDLGGTPHSNGLIIGGALWDLRSLLIAELGQAAGIAAVEKILVGIFQRASDMPTAYLAAQLADDDNGDLADGTPNGCAIEAAFGHHGLVPGFALTKISPPIATGREIAVTVTTPMSLCRRPRPARMSLELHAGGEPVTLAMTEAGDVWSVTLPEQPDNTLVRYRVIAEIDDGSQQVFPDNPADPLYQLFLGTAAPIFCERFDADPRWANDGGWDFGVPFGRAGDAPLPFTGVTLLGNDLQGDGRYNAGTDITITTPAIDASGFDAVHLQFRRWLTTDRADRARVLANGTEVWSSIDTVDHVDREWRFVDLALAPRADLTVAFSLTADTTTELGGWNLDDVCVVGFGKNAVCGDGVIDPGEACDGEPGCTADCLDAPVDEGGCCSGGGGLPSLFLGFFAVKLAKPHRRRRIS